MDIGIAQHLPITLANPPKHPRSPNRMDIYGRLRRFDLSPAEGLGKESTFHQGEGLAEALEQLTDHDRTSC
jgi:hypothetical protein